MKSPFEASNPVVFLLGGVEDSVLSLPALRALAIAFKGRLRLVCGRDSDRFLFNELPLRCQIALGVRYEGGVREFDVDLATCDIDACDLFISLTSSQSRSLNGLLERLSPALSVGFFDEFQIRVPLDHGKHAADSIFDIVRALMRDVRLSDHTAPPSCPEESWVLSQELRNVLPAGTRILAVHNDTEANKMWPDDHLAAALDTFLHSHQNFFALLLGKRSQPLHTLVHSDRVISNYTRSVPTSFCSIASADLFLGNHSYMLHAADFFRVPGVGLFGPTRVENWGFLVGPGISIQGNASMESIEVDLVCNALNALFSCPNRYSLWHV